MFDAVKFLGQEGPPARAHLLEAIEHRRESIRPYLGTFTFLGCLGDLPLLRDNGNPNHGFKFDNPAIDPDGTKGALNSSAKGIFFAQPREKVPYVDGTGFVSSIGGFSCPNGVILVWGLSLANEWILAQVSFSGEENDLCKGSGYERAKEVKIRVVDLDAMIRSVGIKPEEALKELDDALRSCFKATHERVEKIVADIEMVENIVFGKNIPQSSANLRKVKP